MRGLVLSVMFFCAAVAHGGDRLRALAEDAAQRHGLDASLVFAVVEVESGWNPSTRSPKGAMGLMQLMRGTASELGVEDPYEPWQNLDAGCRYLRRQIDRFGDLSLALAAYNAGPERVSRGGIPAFRETREYVARVMELAGMGYERVGLNLSVGGSTPDSPVVSLVPAEGSLVVLREPS